MNLIKMLKKSKKKVKSKKIQKLEYCSLQICKQRISDLMNYVKI